MRVQLKVVAQTIGISRRLAGGAQQESDMAEEDAEHVQTLSARANRLQLMCQELVTLTNQDCIVVSRKPIKGVGFRPGQTSPSVLSLSLSVDTRELDKQQPAAVFVGGRLMESGSSKGMNTNAYATKKTVAQGMLDIALLTANASQLKYVLQVGEQHEFYVLMIVMISISILLQVLVGIGFLLIGSLDINIPEQQKRANRLNNGLTATVFIITVINVLISAFGMKQTEDQQPIKTQ